MLLPICLPNVLPGKPLCNVRAVHAALGRDLAVGDAVIDFSADLGAGQSFDCAPVAHFRLALAEPGRIARLDVQEGQDVAPDDIIAMIEVAGDHETARPARVNVASILFHDDWWDEL